MKLTTFILMIALAQVSAATFAQKLTYSKQGASLQEVFKQIKTQTGYNVLYSPDQIDVLKKVNINFKQTDLKEVLNKLIDDETQEYAIIDNNILIKEKELSFLDRASSAIQSLSKDLFQSINVRGRVLDSETGNALEGATVKVKGSSRTTTTNDKGEFFLSGVDEDAMIMVNFIGYKVLEVKAVGNVGDLRMVMLAAELKEVAISTGYQQFSPERFVGSATVVDSAVLERQVGRDLLTRLDGTTNGLLFNKTGGSGMLQIQLRGISTLNFESDLNGLSSQNPLIILDDFPYTGDINNINPNSIASISILKDAVATSIWGARAGNGVIVIKSKAGNLGKKTSLTFSSNVSITDKPDLHYFPQMSSSDFIDVEQDLFGRGFYDVHLQYPQYFSTSPVVEILAEQRAGNISETDAKAQIDALRSLDVRSDVDKYIYRRGVNRQNYLNFSGGTYALGYNLSFGADNNISNVQGPGGNERYTLSSKFQLKPIKPLQITIALDYNNERNRYDGIRFPFNPGSSSRVVYPYARLADEYGDHLTLPVSFGSSYLKSLPRDKVLDWSYRPLDERDLTNNKETTNLIRMNFGGNVRLISWLSTDIKYQYTRQSFENKNLHDGESYFARNLVNTFTDPITYNRNIPAGGMLDLNSRQLSTHNIRGQLNIRHRWSEVHEFTAMIAGEMSQSTLDGNMQRLYGYNEDVLSYANNVDYATNLTTFTGGRARVPNPIELENQQNNLVSGLANVSYLYDQRYSIYVSGRRDGSNLFGVATNNKYKPLWSIGGRWNISNEAFYQSDWSNNLALRVTYGYAGNINNSISAFTTILHNSRPSTFGEYFASLGNAPNPDLRWEEVRTTNAALDFSLFKSRISGTTELYHKRSKDVIAIFPVDPTLGLVAGSLAKNAANLETKGFDLAIHSQNLTGRFGWNTNINFNYARTTVSKYFVETVSVPTAPIIREGDVYLGLYAFRWAGLDPETGDPRGYIDQEISSNYQDIFQDSLDNQQYVGSPFPLYYGNMMNTFSFIGFSLSTNISFRANYYFRKPTISYSRLYNNWEGHGDYAKRWKSPGDDNRTNVPSMLYPSNSDRDMFYEYSSVNFEKGDHIRLQDIRLSYQWVNKKSGRNPIKSVEAFGYMNNINLMIWKSSDSSYDPDFPTYDYPPLKTISFGVNLIM